MTVEEAGRIQQTDLANFVWADGQPAAEGNDGLESFAWLTFRTIRYNFPVLLGRQDGRSGRLEHGRAVLQLHQGPAGDDGPDDARRQRHDQHEQLYRPRTCWTWSTRLPATPVRGRSRRRSGQDIKRSLNVGAELILKDTLNGVKLNELVLVVNPTLAREMAESPGTGRLPQALARRPWPRSVANCPARTSCSACPTSSTATRSSWKRRTW